MKRILTISLILGLCAIGAFSIWSEYAGRSDIELSDEDREAAMANGEASREITISAVEEVIPAIGDLDDHCDRNAFRSWSSALENALGEAPPEERADILIQSAEIERLLGNLEVASERAKEGAEALASNSQARYVYANTLLAQILADSRAAGDSVGIAGILKAFGPAKRCKTELEQALELDGTNHDARVKLVGFNAFVGFPLGSMGKARELVAGMAAYDDLARRYWEVQLLVAEEKFDEALAAYKALRSDAPDDADVQAGVAEMLAKQEDWRAAAEIFDDLARDLSRPRGYASLYEAAKARELGGFERERALADLEKVEEARPVGDLIPTMDRVMFHKGVVLSLLGRTADARAALLEAQTVSPNSERIQEALAGLK